VKRDSAQVAEAKLAELVRALDYSVVLASQISDWHGEASVVLPIAAWSEEDGTYTNYEGRVQMAGKAVEPPGDALPAWEVFAMLIHHGGQPSPWMSAAEVFAELSREGEAFQGLKLRDAALPGVVIA
jgi:predicted molibdopterin-dependent oxidoreductase YjgC